MRFGKPENNKLLKLLQTAFAFLIFGSCAFSVACQSREQKVDSALKNCQDLLDRDDLAEAYKCYLKVGKTYPESDPYIVDTGDKAIFRKCSEFKEKKDFKQAVFCLEGLTKLRPGGANIYFLLADSYYEIFKMDNQETGYRDTKLLDKAEDAIKKGLEITPEDAPAHALYGDIFNAMNKGEKALQEYRTAVKFAPKDGVFWVKLAMSQEKSGYNDIAVWSFQQALKLNPDDDVALYFLGALYEKMGKLDEAIETIEKRMKLEPASGETLQKLKDLKNQRELERQKPSKSKSKAAGQGAGLGDKP